VIPCMCLIPLDRVTGGMKTLLRQGLQRLAGASGQAVFELKQAMGGGKTASRLKSWSFFEGCR
jgi:hypothetical protein